MKAYFKLSTNGFDCIVMMDPENEVARIIYEENYDPDLELSDIEDDSSWEETDYEAMRNEISEEKDVFIVDYLEVE